MYLSFDVAPCQRVTTITLYSNLLADLPLAPIQCTVFVQECKDGMSVGQMVTLEQCCKACAELAPIVSVLQQDTVFDEHGIARATLQIYLTPEHNRRMDSAQFFLKVQEETEDYGKLQSNAALIPLRREQQCYIDDITTEEYDMSCLEDLPAQQVMTIALKVENAILRKRCRAVRWGEEIYPIRMSQEIGMSPHMQIIIPGIFRSLAQKDRLHAVYKRKVELLNAEHQPMGNLTAFSHTTRRTIYLSQKNFALSRTRAAH